MDNDNIGIIVRISGSLISIKTFSKNSMHSVEIRNFMTNYISIGSLVGAHLLDGRTLVLTIEEVYENDDNVFLTASISGIFDSVLQIFTFGTNSYPLIGETVFRLGKEILSYIFTPKTDSVHDSSTIGTYIYDDSVKVGYNPNILFGKHLGVFGNTGSGKTCTVVSIIQNYIRNNCDKNIKFIILDINGEYKDAFTPEEHVYIPFNQLRLHHNVLNIPEYGRLFRAAEGVQYPALKQCITKLQKHSVNWSLKNLPTLLENWIKTNSNSNSFTYNQLFGNLRTMNLRIDAILEDLDLLSVIDNSSSVSTLETIDKSLKQVVILDLQVSNDSLDIIVYLLFKSLYNKKIQRKDSSHLCLVLEEAHRYINFNTEETKLGNYYIDKISREGRKFGIGLIISSQIPSLLQYEVISQCNSVIMHKITNKKDMEFLKGVLRVSSDIYYLQMNALEKQHAIVCGEAFPNDSIVRIHNAYPLPRSSDPIIEDILSF